LGSDSETRVDIAAAQKQRKQAMPTTPTFDEYLQANNHDPSTITTDMKLALQATYDATHGTGGVDADRIMTIAGSFPPDVISSDRGRALQAAATRGTINASGFQAGLVQIDRDFARADLMVADRPVGPAIHSSSRDTSPDMLCAAFSRSAGLVNMESHFRPEVLEAADRAYPGGVSLGEVLLQAAGEAGYHGRQALRAGNLGEVLRAAFSTHSITTMLTTTGNKMLLDGFNTTEQVWRVISQIKPVKDFKTITSYRLTASLEYELVPPAGEIPHGTLGQDTYTNKADTYAKMLALTRTDIVNDDLGAFDDLRNKLGVGGGRKLNQVFWSTFLSNMATVFTTGRGNLQEGAATALAADGDALQAAEQLFLDMLAPNAEIDDVSPAAEVHPLGIEPAVMLMPTAVGTIGRKLYVSQEIRDTTANTTTATDNLWKNRFKPAVSAYLGSRNTNGSDTGWFLCADPANLPTMQVLFLDGQQSPIVESSDANFSTLGIEMRGYYDFGVSPAEWRASVMSDGTD